MIAMGIAACVLTLWLVWRMSDREARGWADIICEEVYFFEPLEKELSVEDMQKIVDANEKLVKELKDGSK
jgi:hypothetical protein